MIKTIDFLKDFAINQIDYAKFFDCQMAELIDLNFPFELIKALMDQKETVIDTVSKNYQPGSIPFIPVFPNVCLSFTEQLQKIEPEQTFNFTKYEEVARRIVGQGNQPYFLINVEVADWPIKFKGSGATKKYYEQLGQSILNDVETLMLYCFAPKIFQTYYFLMAPGATWNNLDCLLFSQPNKQKMKIHWLSSAPTGRKSCLGVCEQRI
jgi:hypothetical protein